VTVFLTTRLRGHAGSRRALSDELVRTTRLRPEFSSVGDQETPGGRPGRIARLDRELDDAAKVVLVCSRAEERASGPRAIGGPATGVNAILPAGSIRSAASLPRSPTVAVGSVEHNLWVFLRLHAGEWSSHPVVGRAFRTTAVLEPCRAGRLLDGCSCRTARVSSVMRTGRRSERPVQSLLPQAEAAGRAMYCDVAAQNHRHHGPGEDPEIHAERAVRCVQPVDSHLLRKQSLDVIPQPVSRVENRSLLGKSELAEPCDPGPHFEDRRVVVSMGNDEFWILRPRPYEAHLPPDDVPELGNLVEPRRGEESAESGEAFVPGNRQRRTRGVDSHLPELEHVERAPAEADATAGVENRPSAVQHDRDRHTRDDWCEQDKKQHGRGDVEEASLILRPADASLGLDGPSVIAAIIAASVSATDAALTPVVATETPIRPARMAFSSVASPPYFVRTH
jgi:hypothetical protein